MTRTQRLILLIMKMAVTGQDGKQFQNVVSKFLEELSTVQEVDDIPDSSESEMIEGMRGVWEFNDDPNASTIMLTARTMTEFYLNDKLRTEGIDIFS